MSYKLLILVPSAGGKSTLMRDLRAHTTLHIAETDEEVMKANNNVWPNDGLKNNVLVPQTTKEIIARNSVIYFASYIPVELIKEARANGFRVIVLEVNMKTLLKRNKQRMSTENYQDATPWFRMQLENYEQLKNAGLIDGVIDGIQPVEVLTRQIAALAEI